MSKRTDNDMLQEVLQRVVRTETRIMALGTKMGFDLKDEDNIEVFTAANPPCVVLPTLDVPYTSVIKAARRAGLHGKKIIVYFDEQLIAEMPV